jgi:hypothetical protein
VFGIIGIGQLIICGMAGGSDMVSYSFFLGQIIQKKKEIKIPKEDNFVFFFDAKEGVFL